MGDSIMSKLRLYGSTSGYKDLVVPAVSDNSEVNIGNFVSNNSLNTRLGGFVANNFFQAQSFGLSGPISATELTSGSGTYTVPADTRFIYGFALGGGGGGGGDNTGYATPTAYGGSGGSGSAAFFAAAVTPGTSISYAVGSGGAAGSSGSSYGVARPSGTSGGSTTFGSVVTVPGGGGGGGGPNGGGGSGGGSPSGSAIGITRTGLSGSYQSLSGGGAQTLTYVPGLFEMFAQDGNSVTVFSISGPSSSASTGGERAGNGNDGYLILYAVG